MYILDTCTVSYILNNKYPKVREHLGASTEADIAISVITQMELFHGLEKKDKPPILVKSLKQFLTLVTVLPLEPKVSSVYAKMRAQYEKKGIVLGTMDGIIAAHALAEKRILVTHDKAFSRIKELTIEDWTI